MCNNTMQCVLESDNQAHQPRSDVATQPEYASLELPLLRLLPLLFHKSFANGHGVLVGLSMKPSTPGYS